MIPFNLKCYNKDTGVDEYVKIGLFLQNPEDDNNLACDNFVFETDIKYNFGATTTATVTVVLTDGTTHKKYEMIGEGHAKTVEIDSKKYFVLDSHVKFPVLDDNNDIRYPFEILSIRYDSNNNRFIGVIGKVQEFYCNITFPQDEIFKPEIIEKVKKISGVDISSIKERYIMRYSENKFVNIRMLQNYIDCYSEIKEFRECIEKGIESAYRWVVYKPETIKKKAKEALSQLGDNTINDLPLYIKEYIEKDKAKDSEKNILSLCRKKFSEEDFKTYKKIFRNFGNVGNKRYEHFESFVIHFLGSNVPPKEVLHYITLNTTKGKKFTVAEFFNRFEFFENKKICEHIDVEEKMASAIFAGDFNVKKEEIRQRADELKQLMIANAYRQYEDIDLSDVNQWDFSMAIFRIKGKQDIPGHFLNSVFDSGVLVPDTDEIAFILNTYSTSSNEEGMDKYLIVNLSKQIFRIYGLVELAYSEKKYLGLLYRSDDSQKKTAYFDKYMTEDDIREIKKILAKHVYPKYVRQRINSMLCI